MHFFSLLTFFLQRHLSGVHPFTIIYFHGNKIFSSNMEIFQNILIETQQTAMGEPKKMSIQSQIRHKMTQLKLNLWIKHFLLQF